jgi:hypothetical protein
MDAVEAHARQNEADYPEAMAAFGESVAALRDSADLARLTDDPAAPSLEALVRVMTTMERQFQAREGERRQVTAALESRAKRIAEDATKRVEASGAAVVAGLAPELAKLVERMVRQRLWTVRVRTVVISAGLGIGLVLCTAAATYVLARNSGQMKGLQAAKTIQAAMAAGPNAAVAWSEVMAFNDPVEALRLCRKSGGTSASGRHYCALPIWLDPPGPPSAKANR